MDYKSPYTYFFSKPSTGTTNVLWGSLAFFSASLIPVVGQVMWLGYQAEVLDELERDPEIRRHSDFTFDRFSEYLSRGIWVFLMQLIAGLFTAFLCLLAVIPGLILSIQQQSPVFVLAGYLVMVPMLLIGTLFTWPLTMHVQLTGRFRFGAALGFTGQFLKSLWGQLLVTLMLHFFVSLILVSIGLLFCCVGMYPAIVIVAMAQDHFMVQLYRIYLAEGGTPVEETLRGADYDEE